MNNEHWQASKQGGVESSTQLLYARLALEKPHEILMKCISGNGRNSLT